VLAARGSFLDARAHGGRWLVRMEDLDAPRSLPGADARILRTLEWLGLTWDGPVEYQSARTPHYAQALEALTARGLTYPCSCSRAEREPGGQPYPGRCRSSPARAGPTALRFRIEDDRPVELADRIQGRCGYVLGALGDVVIRRRDGVFAYQLAVVVDDALQGVTDVVRGADLIDSTPWQLELYRALGRPTPRHAHLPLLVEPDGAKLSKSRRAQPVGAEPAGRVLHRTLELLRQDPPAELAAGSPGPLLEWAVRHWDPIRLKGLRRLPVPP